MDRSVSKPALITPSASPPPTRGFFPPPYKIPDSPSPSKRQRTSSTPRPVQPHASSAPSSIDIHQERHDSTMRLLNIWSTLVDRYTRPIDEDDIIDLASGEVVKDRGIVRGSRPWHFGCFSDDVEAEGGDGEDEEGEPDDDVDELDSFADKRVSAEGAHYNSELDEWTVPPVEEMDPADAEDLKQFLEAERRRKEIYGTDADEIESSAQDDSEDTHYIADEHSQDSLHTTTLHTGRRATAPGENDWKPDSYQTSPRLTRSLSVESLSDDELVSWGIDEASAVYRLPKREKQGGGDSDVEIIEPPYSPRPKATSDGVGVAQSRSTPPEESSRASLDCDPSPAKPRYSLRRIHGSDSGLSCCSDRGVSSPSIPGPTEAGLESGCDEASVPVVRNKTRKRKRIISSGSGAGPLDDVKELPSRLENQSKKKADVISLSGSETESTSSSPGHHLEYSDRPRHRFNRSKSNRSSLSSSELPYYPYPLPPYTPRHHHQPPHNHIPAPDPRAHYIISQAVHQLSALFGGRWTPPTALPRTPSHRQGHRYSDSSSSIYATPIHHPHPYPYSYEPSLSRGTLPPDSPEVPSSSPMPSERPGSLVPRSRSRGRRVSFKLAEEGLGRVDRHPSPVRGKRDGRDMPRGKGRTDGEVTESTLNTRRGDKGRARAGMVELVEPKSELEAVSRGRRGQTPGPPVYAKPLDRVDDLDKKKPGAGRSIGRPARKHPGRGRGKAKS